MEPDELIMLGDDSGDSDDSGEGDVPVCEDGSCAL